MRQTILPKGRLFSARTLSKKLAATQKNVVDLIFNGDSSLVLVTLHGRGNFGSPLRSTCLGPRRIARLFPQKTTVSPVRMSAVVREPVDKLVRGIPKVELLEPVESVTIVYLILKLDRNLTDPGGIRQEATRLNNATFFVCQCTKRIEPKEAGVTKGIGTAAVGPDPEGKSVQRITELVYKYLGVK